MQIVTGLNEDVDAGTETIWSNGALWLPPTAARVHAIVSSSTDDAAAGTGARTVRVRGIVANGTDTTEIVTLNGTTPVNTTNSYVHISELRLLTVGSGATNAGLITATAATDSTVSAAITVGRNISSAAVLYAASPGDQLVLESATISATLAGAATVSHHCWLLVKPLAAIPTRIPLGCLYSGASSVLQVPLGVTLNYGGWARLDVTSDTANTDVAATLAFTVARRRVNPWSG